MKITCNICGCDTFLPAINPNSGPICENCKSSQRFRRIAAAFSNYIFQCENTPLWLIKEKKPLKGVGLSDFAGYAEIFSRLSNYENTFFHKEPFLDITNPDKKYENYDFLISSDVFEHIPYPCERAFYGAAKVLKSGGTLILTVPILPKEGSQTVEHFPNINKFKIIELDGDHILINKTKSGNVEMYSDLRFHGGPGTTLEFRIFSQSHVVELLKDAGFEDIKMDMTSYPEHAINLEKSSSPVFVAKRK